MKLLVVSHVPVDMHSMLWLLSFANAILDYTIVKHLNCDVTQRFEQSGLRSINSAGAYFEMPAISVSHWASGSFKPICNPASAFLVNLRDWGWPVRSTNCIRPLFV